MDFEVYRKYTDKFESLYTIITHSISKQDVIIEINKKLKIINKLNDNVKRKYLNDRLFSFVTFLNEYSIDTLNNIFLVGNNIHDIKLGKKVNILTEYNIPKFTMKSDDVYYITYLNDLFLNFEFDDVILFNNMTMKHIKLNTTKQKIIYDQNVTRDIGLEYINKNIKDKCLIHGVSSIIKTLKLEKHFIFNKYLTMEQIYECFRKDEMLTKHKRLKECLDYIKNEDLIDRVKFGKDIRDAIDIYMIKTLYCSKIKYDKLKKIYSEDVLNFEILIIDKVEQGDIGDIFMKDYNGIIGYTYY